MSRKPRFKLPGVLQHIVQRGRNRGMFFSSEDDYVRYLEQLNASARKNA